MLKVLRRHICSRPHSVFQYPYRSGAQSVKRIHSSGNEEDVSYDLTKDEAISFAEDVLEIPTPQGLLNTSKEQFIREMVRQVNLKIPFTNTVFVTSDGLRTLSLREYKEAMFTRQGGNCITIASFVWAVLRLFGFDCYIIGGSFYQVKAPTFNDHFAVIVKDVTSIGSLHLLDLGTRYFLEPVSLDFERISPVYQCRHFPYRFFHISAGVVQFCRKSELSENITGHIGSIYVENKEFWEVLTTFRFLQPIRLFDCLKLNQLVAENEKFTPLSGTDIVLIGYSNGKMVNITTKRCVIISENGQKEVIKMTDRQHIAETFEKYFPQYSCKLVEAAMNHYLAG